MPGMDERRFRSVRYFQDPTTKAQARFEPWMTTIVYLDTGRLLGVVDGHRYLRAAWKVKERLRALHRTGSLNDAAAAKMCSRSW